MRRFFPLLLIALLAASCGYDAKVKGRFAGAHKEDIYLSLVTPSKTIAVDTALSDHRGDFSFEVTLPDGQSAFYNVTCRDQSVPLLLSKGDRATVNSICGIAQNYTVKGSDGSEKMHQLGRILSEGMFSLDSLKNLYTRADTEAKRREFSGEYARLYYQIKRNHIRFIIENSNSLAAVYALYQRLPNDEALLDGRSDRIYYQLVADSVSKRFPDSPYVLALRKDIEHSSSTGTVSDMINKIQSGEALNFPELDLPDIYGNRHRLSALEGKVFLLLFWAAADQNNPMLNAELKEIYSCYDREQFEIYAVSADTEKALWINAVQKQRLPWINVSDLRGESSQALRVYNVDRVPSNYLIDKRGNIVVKNIFGPTLARRVEELVKN